ncbi:hypothetical protein EVAR_57787_1 [Eumeta japonica]|uniref:Uncharacterized protein n=1 Tax=Eumeta variegata TaxID=151549 RepID=A0A4C1Y8W1_EUMVA|nr:hypothetical protein EVAR_57787_1 [Eumeta japonica]
MKTKDRNSSDTSVRDAVDGYNCHEYFHIKIAQRHLRMRIQVAEYIAPDDCILIKNVPVSFKQASLVRRTVDHGPPMAHSYCRPLRSLFMTTARLFLVNTLSSCIGGGG